MAEFNRRTFLTRSSLLAAMAGTAAVVPGVLTAVSAEAPELDAAGSDAAAAGADDASMGAADAGAPLVAHVKDLSTGEISVFNGSREVVVQDPGLARSILRAAR